MNKTDAWLRKRLGELPPGVVWTATLLTVLGLGVLDYVTGYDVSFAMLYLLPVLVAAWYLGTPAATFIAATATLCWFLAEYHGGRPYAHALMPIWNATMRFSVFFVVAAIFADRRRQLNSVRELSLRDPLTGCYNRTFLYNALADRHARLQADRSAFAVAYLDLDNFKSINDTQGHEAGDNLLREVARMLGADLGPNNSVCRVGGDEFVLLWRNATRAGIERWAEPCLQRLRQRMLANNWDTVSFSMGIVLCQDPAVTSDSILEQADAAMYVVKKSGKNGVRIVQAA